MTFAPLNTDKSDRSLKINCVMCLVTPVFIELIDLIPYLLIVAPCEEIKISYTSNFTQDT